MGNKKENMKEYMSNMKKNMSKYKYEENSEKTCCCGLCALVGSLHR